MQSILKVNYLENLDGVKIMTEFFASKNFSLACALFNGAFAINSFINGSWLFGLLCVAFCGYCTKNYLAAE